MININEFVQKGDNLEKDSLSLHKLFDSRNQGLYYSLNSDQIMIYKELAQLIIVQLKKGVTKFIIRLDSLSVEKFLVVKIGNSEIDGLKEFFGFEKVVYSESEGLIHFEL
ncbi:hypothetical protein [Membranihabitans maritimus]|uniref:hypothetical protein n=1 Tax=Membranihabitans maritimus TaxID=2904244 RepID=UPI001F43EC5D|nr:hypothetical protein [Membranihabitans maritimus]